MINFKIKETDDYAKLVPFLIENELELTEDDAKNPPTDLVKCWEITEGTGTIQTHKPSGETTGEHGRLIGAFVLAKRDGEFICDGIAVDSEWRGTELGKALLEIGINEAKERGAERMYLVARAPGFFRKHGFVTIDREDAPNFSECLNCPQFNAGCPAEVMRKEL